MRSAMHAASQLSGRGPTDVDVAPRTCMLIKNPTMMMMMMMMSPKEMIQVAQETNI